MVTSLNLVASEDNRLHVLVEQLDSIKIDITVREDPLLKTTSPMKLLNHVAFNDLKDQDPDNFKSHCPTFEKFRGNTQPKI